MQWSRWRRLVAGGLMVAGLCAVLAPGTAFALTAPSAPLSLSGVAGNAVGKVALSWSVPSSTGGGIATYLYDVSTDYNPITHTGTWSSVASLKRTSTKATVPCLATYSAECTYRVYARNAAGTSSASTAYTVAWTVPSAARGLRPSTTNFSDVSLAWTAPMNTGGLTVTYDAQVSNDNGATWSNVATSLSARTYAATSSCTSGFVCEYRVWAKNAVGTAGAASNVAKVTVSPGLVHTVAIAHTSDDVTTGGSGSGTGSMTISWTAPTAGLHDGNYQLEECNGVCDRYSSGWSAPVSYSNSTLSATRTCPAGNITCSYRMRASNTRGGTGAWLGAVYIPTAPVLTSVVTGPTSGTVTATFGGTARPGPPSGAYFQFYVCESGCGTSGNWSLSSTTVSYPPSSVPTSADVDCPTSGASCSVRVQFVNGASSSSMVTAAMTATAD